MLCDSTKRTIDDIGPAVGLDARWITLKKLLLLSLNPSERHKFSRRDEKTKKQLALNDYEKSIILYYENSTGKKVSL